MRKVKLRLCTYCKKELTCDEICDCTVDKPYSHNIQALEHQLNKMRVCFDETQMFDATFQFLQKLHIACMEEYERFNQTKIIEHRGLQAFDALGVKAIQICNDYCAYPKVLRSFRNSSFYETFLLAKKEYFEKRGEKLEKY